MAKINLQRFKENLAASVVKVSTAQTRAVIEGMLALEADMKDRIFLNGLDSENGKIGSYSTNPYYASLNQTSQVRASSLKPRGKGAKKGQKGQGTFKNGKPRKSMYLPGGYAEFRQVVGRQNKTVDLNLTGSLQGDIRVDRNKLAFTTDKQKDIASGNETRFGKTIFSASDKEILDIEEKWANAVTDAFLSSFE